MKKAHLRDMLKKAHKSVCISTAVVSPDTPLSPTASASLITKTPENTREDPDNPELAGGQYIWMEYSNLEFVNGKPSGILCDR